MLRSALMSSSDAPERAEQPSSARPPAQATPKASAEPESAPSPRGPKPPHRARFLETLPPHPELAALAEAFERGNYARVRAEAPRLLETAEDEAVRDAARDLLRRLEPDPLMKFLLGLAIVLLLAATAFAYTTHGHG